MPKPFILVDGSSYLYRAFHALPTLTTAQGQPTGAIYGVLNMLRKLVQTYQPEHIAVVFDAKEKTFRETLYPAYKANRATMPTELQAQIAPLHQCIQAMGLPLLIVAGVEADDVIGTLARQAATQGMATVISTGDKDMAQLVDAHITLVNTMNNEVLDAVNVEKKFGVPPELIIDYLTLIGDTVDNIPGVPNVGPKTAVKWLKEYGCLDNIIAQAEKIGGKVGDNLRNTLNQLPLYKQLITIDTNVPLAQTPAELKPATPDTAALRDLLATLEFKTWLNELKTAAPMPTKVESYQTILSQAELSAWLTKLAAAPYFALDTETTGLDALQAELVGLSFAITPHEAIYLPVAHSYAGAPAQLSRDSVLPQLKPLLEDPSKKKLGHHIKYDMNVLSRYGIQLQGIAFDSMLESYLVDSAGSRHDLDTLALKYLNHQTITFSEVAGKGAKQVTFDQVPLTEATAYAAEDADITLQLHQVLWPKISAAANLTTLFNDYELPLITVLARMEQHGVLIDAGLLQQQSLELSERIALLEQQAYQLAGEVFNLNSPKQLQQVLYHKLNLPILEKTPTGQAATGESVLQELALSYPLPKIILEHRSLSKLKSTYTDRLPEQINPYTGRVHTSYHQAATATGRLSSTDPNLQNIPIRTEAGRRIRRAFIAPPGYKLISADYSQIELRLMAHLSADATLLAAFAQGLDIHQATAAEVLGIPLAAVTQEQRRDAKAINFGLIYGMSAFGLAKQLGIDRMAAQAYIDEYFKRYPGVANYMNTTREKAHQCGYVEDLFGRRLYLPEINAKNLQRQKAAERAAINAPLQGSAADLIKKAMIDLDAWLQHSGLGGHMILQVHDELVFEIPHEAVELALPVIRTKMCQAAQLSVPLVVEIGVGDNWEESHK